MLPVAAGRLLVANPELPDTNFDRSVVLVLAHGPDGSVGVVLNRPGEHAVDVRFGSWDGVVGPDDVIYAGGPVQPDALIGLARRRPGPGVPPPPSGMTEVVDGVGIVDLERPDDHGPGELSGLRVYAGYAGWSPGQLVAEVDAGAWWVVRARGGDPWSARPASLWRDVLRRQTGSLAVVSSYADAPELN